MYEQKFIDDTEALPHRQNATEVQEEKQILKRILPKDFR